MNIDFNKLYEFFKEFILSSPDQTASLIDSIRLTKEIKSYEEMIFDKYRNQELSMRVKGRVTYTKLTESENINYIKYNIIGFEQIYQMWDNVKPVLTPKIASAMVQKLGFFYLTSRNTHPEFQTRLVNVLSDNRYKAILRYTTENLTNLTNRDFVAFLWSLGILHNKEKGLIHFDFFEFLKKQLVNQVSLNKTFTY